MKSAFIVFAAIMLFAIPAHALDEVYYIELGSAANDEQAAREWEALSFQYRTILGHLAFKPTRTIQLGGHPTTRIHAGPIEDKNEAQRLCHTLFAENVPCFVVQGKVPQPSYRQAAPQSTIMPWVYSDYNQPSTLPWRAPTQAAGEGMVEVAEAIPVPVSDMTAPSQNTIRPLFQHQSIMPPPQATEDVGWLTVGSFASEENATALWQRVRESVPQQAAGLRVRINKSLTPQDEPVSLTVGPFASHEGALAFCEQGVRPVDGAVSCRFKGIDAPVQIARDMPYGGEPAPQSRHNFSGKPFDSAAPAAGMEAISPKNTQAYWVQIATAPTHMDAMREWERLREINGDLIGNMRGAVSTSITGEPGFIVRLGPMNGSGKALDLCSELQERGIVCRVFSL